MKHSFSLLFLLFVAVYLISGKFLISLLTACILWAGVMGLWASRA